MKKYVKPMMECEEFVANEYCSVCYKSDLGYYVRLNGAPTDGGLEAVNIAFGDDNLDLLGGEFRDRMPDGMTTTGWYGNANIALYGAQPDAYYRNNPNGIGSGSDFDYNRLLSNCRNQNEKNAMISKLTANPVYYYGTSFTKTKEGDAHPNAS